MEKLGWWNVWCEDHPTISGIAINKHLNLKNVCLTSPKWDFTTLIQAGIRVYNPYSEDMNPRAFPAIPRWARHPSVSKKLKMISCSWQKSGCLAQIIWPRCFLACQNLQVAHHPYPQNLKNLSPPTPLLILIVEPLDLQLWTIINHSNLSIPAPFWPSPHSTPGRSSRSWRPRLEEIHGFLQRLDLLGTPRRTLHGRGAGGEAAVLQLLVVLHGRGQPWNIWRKKWGKNGLETLGCFFWSWKSRKLMENWFLI